MMSVEEAAAIPTPSLSGQNHYSVEKENNNENEDDDDDTVPLVTTSSSSSSRNRNKISPLEVEEEVFDDESPWHRRRRLLKQEEQQQPLSSEDILCWWVIRTILVIIVALIPFVMGILFLQPSNNNNNHHNGVVTVNWEQNNTNNTDSETVVIPSSSSSSIPLKEVNNNDDHSEEIVTKISLDNNDNNESSSSSSSLSPIIMNGGCETKHSFQELIQKMKHIEQFSFELCGIPKKIGKPDKCKCYNPTIGNQLDQGQGIWKLWNTTFENSKVMAEQASERFPSSSSSSSSALELVLLGDSITEHWNGTDLGRKVSSLSGHARAFHKLFDKKKGGKIDAVTLGIAAERCANTLYRLQNNGIGDLHPKVWWVLIGTNDLGGEWCTEDVIVAGNIAIVQELLSLRPDATIVINSILPKGPVQWEHLVNVNDRLRCYAESTQQVEFFNATDIFMDPIDHSLLNLMDGLHPSDEGSMIWGAAIVDKVLEIIQKQKKA